MKVVLFRGRGVISWLIRAQTRGEFSHAALLDDDGTLYEAWQGVGVRKRDGIAPGPGVTLFEIEGITEEQKQKVREWWADHIARGTKYDYLGVMRFVTRRQKADPNRMFCSRAVFESLAHAGVWLFERVEGYRIAPFVLAWAPRLNPV